MIKLLRYLWYRCVDPVTAEYVSMGFGIEARRKRFASAWEYHLQACKSFQQKHLGQNNGDKSIAVLGAGRLYDLNIDVTSRFSEIHLFDKDPTVLPYWEAFREQSNGSVEFHISDICEVETLNYDVIISLNILSQLSLYNQDEVRGVSFEEKHLHLLNTSGAEIILLFTDEYFFHVSSKESNWEVEEALEVKLPIQLSNYNVEASESWLWHLVPCGGEVKGRGELHQVRALYFSRKMDC